MSADRCRHTVYRCRHYVADNFTIQSVVLRSVRVASLDLILLLTTLRLINSSGVQSAQVTIIDQLKRGPVRARDPNSHSQLSYLVARLSNPELLACQTLSSRTVTMLLFCLLALPPLSLFISLVCRQVWAMWKTATNVIRMTCTALSILTFCASAYVISIALPLFYSRLVAAIFRQHSEATLAIVQWMDSWNPSQQDYRLMTGALLLLSVVVLVHHYFSRRTQPTNPPSKGITDLLLPQTSLR